MTKDMDAGAPAADATFSQEARHTGLRRNDRTVKALFGKYDKDNAMTRILLLAATAISLIVPVATADASSRHKGKYYRHHHGAWHAPAYYGPRHYGGWNAPVYLRTPGPPWAMPNECYTDEGYGRFTPCSRGRR